MNLPLARKPGTTPLGRRHRLGALPASDAWHRIGRQLEQTRTDRLQRLVERFQRCGRSGRSPRLRGQLVEVLGGLAQK